ncbi:ABC transporter ATP-binding protein [Chitinophaga varians]|uniref:ABC transporter ATP-binding protein n=1 Tax=Chitinophaga varians TaxID=2202339 RepID=A0A847RXP0_9BACT|nr:ABC transporter ATP-binding protein [Chitinophaga varians]NLR67873.1 ABC transporter ATP-binding protein [Chitinophaga varians]
MSNVIDIVNLGKRHRRSFALSDLNFQINRSEIFGIVGADGSGKTTLCRILSTLDKPDTGDAVILGYSLKNQFQQLRPLIGYLPEKPAIYNELTVIENIYLVADLRKVDKQTLPNRNSELYKQLKEFASLPAQELSGGTKQKLALYLSTLHNPPILLLDEATTGLDIISRDDLWNNLSELQASGTTIIYAGSDFEEVERFSRLAVLNKGKMQIVGTLPEILTTLPDNRIFTIESSENIPELFRIVKGFPGISTCYLWKENTIRIVLKCGVEKFNAYLYDFLKEGVVVSKATPCIEDFLLTL